MTGFAPRGVPQWRDLTREAFLGYIADPSWFDYWRQILGKPRVRVPALSQTSPGGGVAVSCMRNHPARPPGGVAEKAGEGK